MFFLKLDDNFTSFQPPGMKTKQSGLIELFIKQQENKAGGAGRRVIENCQP